MIEEKRMQERPTITSIAREAGVSATVVSAIVNSKENQTVFVGEEKKKKVLALIDRYGYVPQKSARELASRRTNAIGVICQRLTPYFASLVEEFQKQAFARGLEVIAYITEGAERTEEAYLNAMRDGRVDGVIVSALRSDTPARIIRFSSAPFRLKIVSIGPPLQKVPSLHWDETLAGNLVADHLIQQGCRTLTVFGEDETLPRLAGFIRRAREKGAGVCQLAPGQTGNILGDAKTWLKAITTRNRLPDGVFAFNDLTGIALISELMRQGVKVPEEVAVVGCDNSAVCEYGYPSLSSIDTNVLLTAKTALKKLEQSIAGTPVAPLHTWITPKLVVRESSVKKKRKAKKVKKGGGAL